MKTVGKRSYFLLLLVAVFVACALLLTVRFALNGDTWSSQPYNEHLAEGEGAIYDKNGVLLSEGGEDGTVFADSLSVRTSMLHNLGDNEGYISTGVRRAYRSQLSGYNFLTGLSGGDSELHLTLDSDLCASAYELLAGRSGAVFIYNYKNGQVLCKTSSPAYDPMNIPESIETNPYYEGVYLDRVISSTFTPGSIFKVVTALCAMENLPDWESFTSTCTGSVVIGNNEVTCMGEHGTINIRDGLTYSCNVLFAELAVELGKDALTETAASLGFGQSFEFEKSETAKSDFNVEKATDNELAWSGIGQYTDLVSPYHMAVLMGSVANGGQSAKPYMVSSVLSSAGIPVKITIPSKLPALIEEEHANLMKECLRNNVADYYGDDFFPEGMEICAKTGTAQVGNDKDDTAWIIGFSASEETPYAFAVIVEEGGFGLSTAGSIVSELLDQINE